MPAAALRPVNLDAAERRRAEREAVVVTRASVRGQGETPGDAELLDLSIYGCRLRIAAAYKQGARLWLRLDGRWPVRATVIWTDAERIGCRFDEPIANEVMRSFTRLTLDRPRASA
jgi:hypothetical protein